ncbi:proline racemase family protein [Trinickia mobilis]|uniref:proline racemase family protein n=1 Tax=Trinickia mobilis TaxID=2816356 RepID=UPI001A8DB7C8|nr:proline racemase family protein [Trinickia mobilis]
MKMNRTIDSVDVHSNGRPFRLVTRGLPKFAGESLVERRAWLERNADHWRRALFLLPRGYAGLAGGFLTEPVSESANLGMIFVDADGYFERNDDGVIALATVAVALGWVERSAPETRVGIDLPGRVVEAFVGWDGDHAGTVRVAGTQARRAYAHATACSTQHAQHRRAAAPAWATLPQTAGRARICGFSNWIIDESDPFAYGCVV